MACTAAYALIPVSDRRNLHYTIGQRLVAQSRENELHDSIFQLVQQLNYGIDIVTTTEDRDRLAHYNLLAGQKANQSTAFEAARSYLQIAWDLLGPGGKVAQHELWCKVVELLIEVEYSLTCARLLSGCQERRAYFLLSTATMPPRKSTCAFTSSMPRIRSPSCASTRARSAARPPWAIRSAPSRSGARRSPWSV